MMSGDSKLTLCIESSALPYGVVLAQADEVLFDSVADPSLQQLKDVPALVKLALERTERKAAEIGSIMIGIGPGGTSAVRAGVAFANSLAYSLEIPIIPLNAFELMGPPAVRKYNCPVLVTVKSIKGNAYVGWYTNDGLQRCLYGPLKEMVQKAVGTNNEWAVAGAHREQIKELFYDCLVHDTGQKFGLATDMLSLLPIFADKALRFPGFAVPITEQSDLFEKIDVK